MPSLRIIPDLDNATPELREREAIQVDEFIVGGLAAGMTSGKPSVAIIIDSPAIGGGRYIFAQTSLALFLSAADALRAKYGDPRIPDAQASPYPVKVGPSRLETLVSPVSKGETTDRSDPRLRETKPSGQQAAYLVLSEADRAKGYVRPVRRTYIHKKCGAATTMSQAIAETYARDPSFYGATFCVRCGDHFPLLDANGRAFVWDADGSGVGE